MPISVSLGICVGSQKLVTTKAPYAPSKAARRLLGSSRSPFTTSTPRFSSVSADLLAGLRLTTRTVNWPEASNASTTPPPCAPVPPMTVMVCLVMSVSAPLLPAIVLSVLKFGGDAELPEQLDQCCALGFGEPS